MKLDRSTGGQSIRRTLNIQIGAVVLTVGIAIGILFFLFSIRMEEDDFQNNIKLQTRHLSDTFAQQLWLFDLNAARQLSDMAVDSPGIIGLRILDHHKKSVVESGDLSNHSAVTISKELRYEDRALVGYIEISFVNTTWGKHQNLIVVAGLCMLVIIIVTSFFLISSILNRHLVRPLDHLQKDMISLTSGKFIQSEITGQKTEIQNIVDVFNQMTSALADREASQREAEKQLSKEKLFIEALIHTLPGLFYVYEEGRRLIRWNRNFQKISGLTDDEMLNKAPEEWVCEKDKPEMIQAIEKTMAHGDAFIEVDLELKSGTVPYLLTATNFSADGKTYILGVGINVSKRKELEKALRQAHKMESIGTLAGGIAHDFNNILFPLMGYAEMLKEDLPDNSQLKENADQIFQAAMRAKNLVRQILTLSRQSDQELKPLRVQSILKETIKLLNSSIPKTITIHQEIDEQCGLVIADPTQIHQTIMNLSTNAYHAMQESGGHLKFVLEQVEIQGISESVLALKPGHYILLKVIDTGTGIDKAAMDKIFDPYFTTKKMGKGTGLGLSIVQGIVKNCHGDVTIYSEAGKGTEVHVYLPVIEKIRDELTSEPDNTIQTGTERILLVDDEAAIVKMEKQLLERLGYDVTDVVGSRQALDMFKEKPDQYDLILTDMTMPDMTGLQLAMAVKKVRPVLPVIICTGFSDQINSESFKDYNIQGYITKPIVKSKISRIIRDVLDNRVAN